MDEVTAYEIADRIIVDLRDREELGDVVDGLSKYIIQDMQDAWAVLIMEAAA